MSETLLSAWTATVREQPDAVALIEADGRAITRTELDRAAESWRTQFGAGLAGRAVVIAEPNGSNWLRVFIGLLKADAVIAPLDPGEPLAAQRAVAEAIGATALWRDGGLEQVGGGRVWRDGRRMVKLTSGSTGTPRALPFTDAQMLADGAQVCAGMGIRPDDVNFGLIPFGHSYGLGNLVVPLLQQGSTIACGAGALPQVVAAAIAASRATVFPAVPAVLRALAEAHVERNALHSLRTVISAGAPLAPEVAQAFQAAFGRNVHNFYGSSETGGITFDRTGEAALTGRSVGTPLPGVRLVFGRGGRFRVESAAVVTLGNRHRGASGFGAHRPADVGELTGDGELVLRGRTGRSVKIAGRRLNLAEVEQALRAVAGVREAWVAPHPSRPDALAAVVATEQTGDAVREALRERLAAWKIPKKIVTMSAFPLTARGKTDTRALAARLQ